MCPGWWHHRVQGSADGASALTLSLQIPPGAWHVAHACAPAVTAWGRRPAISGPMNLRPQYAHSRGRSTIVINVQLYNVSPVGRGGLWGHAHGTSITISAARRGCRAVCTHLRAHVSPAVPLYVGGTGQAVQAPVRCTVYNSKRLTHTAHPARVCGCEGWGAAGGCLAYRVCTGRLYRAALHRRLHRGLQLYASCRSVYVTYYYNFTAVYYVRSSTIL